MGRANFRTLHIATQWGNDVSMEGREEREERRRKEETARQNEGNKQEARKERNKWFKTVGGKKKKHWKGNTKENFVYPACLL